MGNADAVISAIGGSGDASTYHAVDNEVLILKSCVQLCYPFLVTSVSTEEVLCTSVCLAMLRHQRTPWWGMFCGQAGSM